MKSPLSCQAFTLTILLVCLVPPTRGQTSAPSVVTHTPYGAPAVDHSMLLHSDSTHAGPDVSDPQALVELIVRFQAPPLGRGIEAAKGGALDAERDALYRTLSALQVGAAKQGREATVLHDYRRAFNGMALTAPRWMRSHLEALPQVDHVLTFPVMAVAPPQSNATPVRATAREFEVNRIIGATRVHNELDLRGQGVLIGVLSSGIDYMHPDLGGGIGPEFTVVGGYDFVNDDADPMDDVGLGTLAAGLIAGDAGPRSRWYRGVAHDARLLAIKVIGEDASYHYVSVSTMLAGLDYALDPDGDPATDDVPEVLYIGAYRSVDPFNASDPMAEAVNTIVEAGIVCVASGDGYKTFQNVPSPANAERAITVGATTAEDELASTTLFGPTQFTYLSKPDVLSPGFSVEATQPLSRGSKYGMSWGGAPTAAAHVAGAVALLLEDDPTLQPDQVKSKIVHGALDLNLPVRQQGGGRLDVYEALQRAVVVTPTAASFGQLPATEQVTTERTFTFQNTGMAPVSYDLALQIFRARGVQLRLSRQQMTIAPGASETVTLSFTADPAEVPYLDSPRDYLAALVATNADETIELQLSFGHVNQLSVDFEQTPDLFYIIDDDVRRFYPTSSALRWPVPKGTYSIMAAYSNVDLNGDTHLRYVVRDDVAVEGQTAQMLSPSLAKHAVDFDLRGADGQPITADYQALQLQNPAAANGFVQTYPFMRSVQLAPASLQFSTFSAAYRVDVLLHNLSDPSGDDYTFRFSITDGISESVTLQNAPDALVPVETEYVLPPYVTPSDELLLIPRQYFSSVLYTTAGYDEAPDSHYILRAPYVHRLYAMPRPDGHSFPYDSFALYRRSDDLPLDLTSRGGENLVLIAPVYELTVDSLWLRRAVDGFLPPRVSYRSTNTDIRHRLGSTGFFSGNQFSGGIFLGPHGEVVNAPIDVRYLTDDRQVDAEVRPNFWRTPTSNLAWNPRESFQRGIRLTFEDAQTDGLPARIVGEVRHNGDSRNVPDVTHFQATHNGRVSDVFTAATPPTFYIEADIAIQRESNEPLFEGLFYRRHGDIEWMPLSTTPSGSGYEAAWPENVPGAYYDVRADFGTVAGNTLSQRIVPMFRFGERSAAQNQPPSVPTALAPLSEALGAASMLTPTTFRWTAPVDSDPGDDVRLRWRLVGPGTDLTLAPDTDSTLTVTLQPYVSPEETYQWWVEAADGFSIVSSDTTAIYVQPNIVSTEEHNAEVPTEVALTSNYPNPFTEATTLEFTLPEPLTARLDVFDTLGRRVATLAQGWQAAGTHRLEWQAGAAPSGVYFARLQAGTYVKTLRMVRAR